MPDMTSIHRWGRTRSGDVGRRVPTAPQRCTNPIAVFRGDDDDDIPREGRGSMNIDSMALREVEFSFSLSYQTQNNAHNHNIPHFKDEKIRRFFAEVRSVPLLGQIEPTLPSNEHCVKSSLSTCIHRPTLWKNSYLLR